MEGRNHTVSEVLYPVTIQLEWLETIAHKELDLWNMEINKEWHPGSSEWTSACARAPPHPLNSLSAPISCPCFPHLLWRVLQSSRIIWGWELWRKQDPFCQLCSFCRQTYIVGFHPKEVLVHEPMRNLLHMCLLNQEDWKNLEIDSAITCYGNSVQNSI